MTENEDYVFAVDKWEGLDGLHHVTVKISGELITVKFEEWAKAEEWANYTARAMGLKKYQIDTPDRPHTWVSVREKEGELKMPQEKVTPFETLCILLSMLSGMTFILSALIGVFEWIALVGILFGLIMPKVIKRMNKK